MRYIIIIFLIIFLTPHKTMANLSRGEVWEKATGQSKRSMPKSNKGLSRREIWANATGGNKENAPSYTKAKKKKKEHKANSKKNIKWVEAHENELFPRITD